jgi:hypothetical protein
MVARKGIHDIGTDGANGFPDIFPGQYGGFHFQADFTLF